MERKHIRDGSISNKGEGVEYKGTTSSTPPLLDVVKTTSEMRPQRVKKETEKFASLQKEIEKGGEAIGLSVPNVKLLTQTFDKYERQALKYPFRRSLGKESRDKGEIGIKYINATLEQYKECKEEQAKSHLEIGNALEEDKTHLKDMAENATKSFREATEEFFTFLRQSKDRQNIEEPIYNVSTKLRGAYNVYKAMNSIMEVYKNEGEEELKLDQINFKSGDAIKAKLLGVHSREGHGQNQPNEDAYFCDEKRQIFIVCDGTSDHYDSYIAAQLTCKFLAEKLSHLQDNMDDAESKIQDMMIDITREMDSYAKKVEECINQYIDMEIYEKLQKNKNNEIIIDELNEKFIRNAKEYRKGLSCEIYNKIQNGKESNELEYNEEYNKELRDLAQEIKEQFLSKSDNYKLRSTMGTTVAAVMLKNEYAIMINVGDSRVCRQKSGSQSLVQITHDGHREVSTTGDFGPTWPGIYQKVAAYLPSFEGLSGRLQEYIRQRNSTPRLETSGDFSPPSDEIKKDICNIYVRKCSPGDKFSLTTDGIHDNIIDDKQGHILSTSLQPAKDLVAGAKKISEEQHPDRAIARLQRSKKDDMTAIVIQVE